MKDQWQQWCEQHIKHLRSEYEHAESYKDLLQQALFTNALYGSELQHSVDALQPQPTTVHWNGLDLESSYRNHLQTARELLDQNGWIDSAINYTLNSWGFRSSREFHTVTDSSLVVMGCSFTFGTGLHEHQLWGQILARRMGLELINLGVPGHGLNLSTQWLLSEGHNQLKDPRAIVICVPPAGRLAWIESAHGYAIGNTYMVLGFDKYPRLVQNIAVNAYMDYIRNHNTICLWAEQRGIPVHVFTDVPKLEDYGLARDLQHHGAGWHRTAASMMLQQML